MGGASIYIRKSLFKFLEKWGKMNKKLVKLGFIEHFQQVRLADF